MRSLSPDRGKQALRAAGRLAAFRRTEALITAGAPADEVLLIEQGLVKVVLQGANGERSLLGLFGPGALLGDMGVLAHRPRSADVIALRSGIAVHVAATTFRQLHGVATDVRELVDEVARTRLRTADERQLAQTREVPERVVLALLKWAREFGHADGDGLVLHGLSQRELAQAINASDKHVEAALRSLRSAGLIRTRRLWFSIPRPKALEELVNR